MSSDNDKVKVEKEAGVCKHPDEHPAPQGWCFSHGNYCTICYLACPVCQPNLA